MLLRSKSVLQSSVNRPLRGQVMSRRWMSSPSNTTTSTTDKPLIETSSSYKTEAGFRQDQSRYYSWVDQDPTKWKPFVEHLNQSFKQIKDATYDPHQDGTSKNKPREHYDDYRDVLQDFLHRVVPRGVLGHNWRGKVCIEE